jgi:2,4-dienoyl-CoA reductase (NADPH2)
MEIVKLLEPITINGLEIPNRTVMPSMGLAYTNDYTLTDRFKAFYRERAEGGVGLMTIGPIAIDKAGSAPFMPALFEDQYVEPMKRFIEELHRDTDAKIANQLIHLGRAAWSIISGVPSIAPSPMPSKLSGETPKEMTREDIEDVQQAYVQAARRSREAGFDFVEILACTGYLISQFLSPVTNKRTDEYGGSIENRMRFGLEVIARVRQELGKDFPLGIRIAGNDFMEGGHTNEESATFAAEAEKAGVDAVNVTGGWHETYIPQLNTGVPPGTYVYLARGIKDRVGVPVFASNRLGDPYVAERAVRSGACDMVCWGRPLIADPELPNKVKEGRFDEIVPCIACNQGCFDSIFGASAVFCVLNPRAGRELEVNVRKTEKPKRVMVAGGGPAGMEFALTAAQAGHDVTLYEKEDSLGGQINLAKASPGKAELGKITDSMRGRMKRHGVKVELGCALTPETIEKEKPDVLAVASGARPLEMSVPGIDKPHVHCAWDVLMERVADIGKNVVIVGGNATGCETAHFLTAMGTPDPAVFTFLMYHTAENPESAKKLLHNAGRTITVVEMVQRLAGNVGRSARWPLMKSLKMMGVNLRRECKLLEIRDDSVLVETEEGRESLPADTVIMAVGSRSVNDLAPAVMTEGVKVVTLGDAKEPRKLTEAIREGFEEALKI